LSITVGVTALLLGAAALRGWMIWDALRRGVLANGQVVSSMWTGPGLRPSTIDAQVHGAARGTWMVRHPKGPFEATFESDAPWAGQLVKGTEVQVLVDPVQPRVLLDLGPIYEGQAKPKNLKPGGDEVAESSA
jgi:hypothetical protein